VRIRSPEGCHGESGEREADSLFGFIAELGALLRGEQSDATLQAVDDKMTPPSRVRPHQHVSARVRARASLRW